MHQGHSADDGSAAAVARYKARQRHRRALRPEPDAVGRLFALGAAGFVTGQMLQLFVGQFHEVPEDFGVFIAGEFVFPNLLAEDIVGRRGHQSPDVAATLLGNVAEGGRGRDGHARRLQGCVEFRVGAQLGDDGHGGFAVDGSGVVGENFLLAEGLVAVLQANHIAPEAGAAGLEGNAAAGGLQGAAAGKVPPGIAAEDGEDGRVAAGGKLLGHRAHAAQHAAPGKGVDGGGVHRLQGCFPAQFRHGIVRHAVADHKKILHKNSSFPKICANVPGIE